MDPDYTQMSEVNAVVSQSTVTANVAQDNLLLSIEPPQDITNSHADTESKVEKMFFPVYKMNPGKAIQNPNTVVIEWRL